jgi:hypothetical protein
MMEAREQYCRSEAARLADRARVTAGKVERTKNMVLYYLLSRASRRSRGTNSRYELRRTARIPFELPTRPRCRSAIARLMRELTGLSGRRCSRFFLKNFLSLWSRLFKKSDRT